MYFIAYRLIIAGPLSSKLPRPIIDSFVITGTNALVRHWLSSPAGTTSRWASIPIILSPLPNSANP